MADAAFHLDLGQRFPYDGEPAGDDPIRRAVLGILSDLCDRREVKWPLNAIRYDHPEVAGEIVESLTKIVRLALDPGHV
jgi:hypothetical protein